MQRAHYRGHVWPPGLRVATLIDALVSTAPRVSVVLGNHDRLDAAKLERQGIGVITSGTARGTLRLTHEAREQTGAVTLGGHVHPVAKVQAPGERLRLPCFVVSRDVLILPAFGSMSGGWDVDEQKTVVRVACFHGALIALDAEKMQTIMTHTPRGDRISRKDHS